ncbi:hypothetical protein B0H16DRAFT_1465965 [Mycena metata]|uniref:Uncharacterized protein n=1 Tax=Mycena metata TaxID=1033252 RepID=A0AAD7IB43_9AGAR|nr:hypothetical protein B0H16DRAFT_1465965 [Mycena metata]
MDRGDLKVGGSTREGGVLSTEIEDTAGNLGPLKHASRVRRKKKTDVQKDAPATIWVVSGSKEPPARTTTTTATTTTIAPPGGRVVLIPAATNFGPSCVIDSSPYPVPSIAWTRFRHANINIVSEKISPLHTAFCPRQRRADMPPIARWDPRAAKFLAICASQPPVSSRAACARYRLGRKTADQHNALMRRFDRLRRDLTELNTTIIRLYDTHTILPPSILANVIHDVERASSLYRTLRATAAVDIVPEHISLPSTLLHGSLKPSTPPCVPLSTPVDFFGR